MVIRPYVLATGAVLPLVAAVAWSGLRVGLADPLLAVIAPSEQPLSARSPGALWAACLVLVWFGLGYWRRQFAWWEPILVIGCGAAALVRAGNLWLAALALVLPLARQ